MAKLTLEIADTPLSLAQGLMGRQELPQDKGMLFRFSMPVEASFWGKNTYIPLDVAFIDSDNKICDIKNITPMSTRSVRSSSYCTLAIEANQGFFDRNGIKVGTSVNFITNEDANEVIANFK